MVYFKIQGTLLTCLNHHDLRLELPNDPIVIPRIGSQSLQSEMAIIYRLYPELLLTTIIT